MATTYTIQGGTVSSATEFKDLGLTNLVRRRRNLARDEISFSHPGAAVDSTALFAYGDVVTVRRVVSGVTEIIFKGPVIEVPRIGVGGATEELQYRVGGTWWYYENLVYQQNWPTVADSTARRGQAMIGFNASTDARIATKTQVQDIVDWLQGSGGSPVSQYSSIDLPVGVAVPFYKLESPTCAEAIQAICRWHPDAIQWFDYTTSPPTLHLTRRAFAGIRSYALTALESVDLAPRNDLKIDRVLIHLVNTNSGGGITVTADADPGGTTGREFGSLVFAIVDDFTAAPLSSGLAAAYRAGINFLHYQGKITFVEEECTMAVTPGELIDITGGPSIWTSMHALVQEVTEDIDAGRTTIIVGPPSHLRFSDFMELMRPVRRTSSDNFMISSGKKQVVLTSALSVAGAVPTSAEIKSAIESAYSGVPKPLVGDIVHLTVSSKVKFRCFTHTLATNSGTGLFVVNFVVSGVQYYAHVYPTGLF